tara:strand:+ start:124 stop:342 length:219 start_codon:yes stop_codon:yes gene_type:complete
LIDSDSKNKFWDLKPFWCQPWSIISFGILLLIFSWILFNNIIISLLLGFIVIIWWILFLVIAPNSYQEISDE